MWGIEPALLRLQGDDMFVQFCNRINESIGKVFEIDMYD